jgi:hypothetical protein
MRPQISINQANTADRGEQQQMPNTKLERLFPLDRSRGGGMRPPHALPNLSVAALRGKLSHDDVSGYNAAQKFL